jgi:hypothetical protein
MQYFRSVIKNLVSSFVLVWNSSISLRKQKNLHVFEIKLLCKIFKPKKAKVKIF